MYIIIFALVCVVIGYRYITLYEYWNKYNARVWHPKSSDNEKEWGELSWNGKNPAKVIELANKIAGSMNSYRRAVFMTSAFYSQIKFLLKKGEILTALVFIEQAKKWAQKALNRRAEIEEKKRSAIDLEVLGATDFLLSRIPVFGQLYKTTAIKFLEEADDEARPVYPKVSNSTALEKALIWSKLFVLTKDIEYKEAVRDAGLKRTMEEGQLRRIARHLGFKDLLQFYTYYGM